MGLLTRLLTPRKVRRVVHPGRAVKRAVTPKSVKQVRRTLSPIDNATYSLTRSLNTKKRRRAKVYRHDGCSIRHRSLETMSRCGR